MGSAVLAVSWILTALLLALTRKRPEGWDDAHGPLDHYGDITDDEDDGEDGLGQKDRMDFDSYGTRLQRRTGTAAGGKAEGRQPLPLLTRRTALLPPPYMDEQAALEVRRCVTWYASVIPATPFEGARMCNTAFGLRFDAAGYMRLLLPEPEEEVHQLEETDRLEDAADLWNSADRRSRSDAESGGGGGGYAALGLKVLESHIARYACGVYAADEAWRKRPDARCAGVTDGRADGSGVRLGGSGEHGLEGGLAVAHHMQPRYEGHGNSSGLDQPEGVPAVTVVAATNATAAVAAAAAVVGDCSGQERDTPPRAGAVLATVAAYTSPKVLAGLARRLRLDLLAPPPAPARHSSSPAAAAAPVTRAAARGSWTDAPSGGLDAGGLAGRGGGGGRVPAGGVGGIDLAAGERAAAALLRLVWAAHVADPGAAWRCACVLVGLAHELKLVG